MNTFCFVIFIQADPAWREMKPFPFTETVYLDARYIMRSGKVQETRGQTHTLQRNDSHRFHLYIMLSLWLASTLTKTQYKNSHAPCAMADPELWDLSKHSDGDTLLACERLCGGCHSASSQSPWGTVPGVAFHFGSDSFQPWRTQKNEFMINGNNITYAKIFRYWPFLKSMLDEFFGSDWARLEDS